MFEYLNNIDRDSIEFIVESEIAQYGIDRDMIKNEYNMSIKMLSLNDNIFTEAEDIDKLEKSKVAKFKTSASNMLKALCASTGKALDSISNKLTSSNNATIDDYLKSKEGSVRLEKDIAKIQEKCKRESLEGDKLLQKVTSATNSVGANVSDEEVENFVKRTIEIFDDNSEAIITAAAASTIYARQLELYDLSKKRANKDGIFQQCKTMESQTKCTRIINAINNMTNKEFRIFGIFMNKYDKLSDKKNKEIMKAAKAAN